MNLRYTSIKWEFNRHIDLLNTSSMSGTRVDANSVLMLDPNTGHAEESDRTMLRDTLAKAHFCCNPLAR